MAGYKVRLWKSCCFGLITSHRGAYTPLWAGKPANKDCLPSTARGCQVQEPRRIRQAFGRLDVGGVQTLVTELAAAERSDGLRAERDCVRVGGRWVVAFETEEKKTFPFPLLLPQWRKPGAVGVWVSGQSWELQGLLTVRSVQIETSLDSVRFWRV